ncbi:type II toxin-antitoxin system RelE family toxin [Lentilactobacillus kisonensis]|nr:hypothetical protein [Lentilactobacillus kisonensis]EHO46168.1 toxin-antitoxin system, toxin component, RelE family [Lentilactobacillus kisonensis F0435]
MMVPTDYHLKYFRQAAKEKRHLDGSQLKIVNKGLKRIKVQGMKAGKPLNSDLKDCREIKHRELDLRIIFRQNPNNKKHIDIVGIGKREAKLAYKQASYRLSYHNASLNVDDISQD